MDVQDYCRNMETELTTWKAKLYDVTRQMDNLSIGDKERMYEQVNDLHIVMTEFEDRLDQLRTSCPTDWALEREEMTVKLTAWGTGSRKLPASFLIMRSAADTWFLGL